MHLASPRIGSLPILHLVLLLLAHYTAQAQGTPLGTHRGRYLNYIKEIETILDKPAPPQNDVNTNEKSILRDENFLKINLDEFLEATKNLTDMGKKIRENLENFKTVLPNTTSTEHPIYIEEGNWDDFRRKLKEYLRALRDFLVSRMFSPTS